MAEFLCRVMMEDGKVIEEQFSAESKSDLLIAFQNRGYRPIRIEEERRGFAEKPLGAKKLKLKSLILFCRQMSTLLRSGVPLVKCFDIIASQVDNKLLKKTMVNLSDEVQAGAVMSKAMEKQGDVFPEMLVKMVEVGEVTGDLTQIMAQMANQYESDNRLKKKVRGALIYPIVLIVIALVACVFMLIVVVPQFVDIFEQLDTDLPALTRILLALSDFIVNRWYILVLVVPILVVGLMRFLHTDKVTRWIDEKKLTLRMIRVPIQKLMCAQLARTLHTLISCGVTITQALEYTNRNINNKLANECIDKIIVGVRQGKGISTQLAEYPIFPKLLISMISIGEASGNLEEMLSKTADYYDEEMEAAISQLTTMIEPIMILIVGILIGGIVMALYAPMFGAISAMSSSL
jgi:type IV pilus assembly protein PilC